MRRRRPRTPPGPTRRAGRGRPASPPPRRRAGPGRGGFPRPGAGGAPGFPCPRPPRLRSRAKTRLASSISESPKAAAHLARSGARPSAPSAANALNSSSRAAGSTKASVRRGVQVVREPRLRGFEAHPGRGGHRDALDPGRGALGHRVERADVLDLVAEEVEAVGLGRRDRVDVDDAAADGVVARRLADRLAVVIEVAQPLEERLERLAGSPREDHLARRIFLDRGDRLEKRGGSREDGQDRARGVPGERRPGLAKPRKHGEPVARGRERLPHVPAVGNRFGKDEGLEARRPRGGPQEDRGVLRQLLRRP